MHELCSPGQDPLAAARCIDRLPLEILLSRRWDFPRHIAFWQRPSRASIALIQATHLTSINYRAGLDGRASSDIIIVVQMPNTSRFSKTSDRCGDAPLLSFSPGKGQKRRIHVAGPSGFDPDTLLQAV